MIILRLLVSVFLLFSCHKKEESSSPPPSINNSTDIKVLYIGNSLTYYNDLPSIVTELGKQDGITISEKSITAGNYSLEDHWNDGKIQTEITTGKYNFVVVQQGPSALPESQELLLNYVRKIKPLCSAAGSSLCMYMVWPSKDRSFDLDNVIYSYTQAANQTNSLLAPAGLAWKHAWTTNAQLPLYGGDDFHPSLMGSVLAAITIYGSIKQKKDLNFLSYEKLPGKNSITEAQYAILKSSALKALGY